MPVISNETTGPVATRGTGGLCAAGPRAAGRDLSALGVAASG